MDGRSGISFPILVSACLCGDACRYDGTGAPHPVLVVLRERGLALPVCPEVLGGLAVPREPCERQGDRVKNRAGCEVTAHFALGARKTLELARENGISVAVLKERSPSCGSSFVYDGTFTGRRAPGQGVTTEVLRENGIVVFSEENFPFDAVTA